MSLQSGMEHSHGGYSNNSTTRVKSLPCLPKTNFQKRDSLRLTTKHTTHNNNTIQDKTGVSKPACPNSSYLFRQDIEVNSYEPKKTFFNFVFGCIISGLRYPLQEVVETHLAARVLPAEAEAISETWDKTFKLRHLRQVSYSVKSLFVHIC